MKKFSLHLLAAALAVPVAAQMRLPGYEASNVFAANRDLAARSRAILTRGGGGRWAEGHVYFIQEGNQWRAINAKTGKSELRAQAPAVNSGTPQPRVGGQPARGRQRAVVTSPDGQRVARYADGNITLEMGGQKIAITTAGDLTKRIKFGTASWVYGEELEQRDAMGFSPDGEFLWYYGFDESAVKDFFTLLNQRTPQVLVESEAYPKPGNPNPTVNLYVYSVQTGKSVTVASRPGAFDDGIGHYLLAINWSPDGKSLIFTRMNRRQNEREVCAADPRTGLVRVIDREVNPAGWVEYDFPRMVVGKRWLATSEDTGYANLYWIDIEKGQRTAVTRHDFDVYRVVKVDEARQQIWYVGAGGNAPYRHQLYRIGFDGKGGKRLTDPAFHHAIELAEDGQGFVDTYETADQAPRVVLRNGEGAEVEKIKESDTSPADKAGVKPTEFITFSSLDGKVKLNGRIHFPPDFDPKKKYPVLIEVYGGPLPVGWSLPAETYTPSKPLASYGFIVAEFIGRGTNGRGRDFRQAINEKLGIVEIDDQAAGAKYLTTLPYVDSTKIAIEGTSYGGYASLMCLLRYPDLFAAACSQSMVSDWRNYDTTYTERYMGLLPANDAAYRAGSAMTYAGQLKGALMIYYGTADDNTHPVNSLQVIAALQRAGKSFEVQVGPDAGHSGLGQARMLEFFIERMGLTGSPAR